MNGLLAAGGGEKSSRKGESGALPFLENPPPLRFSTWMGPKLRGEGVGEDGIRLSDEDL